MRTNCMDCICESIYAHRTNRRGPAFPASIRNCRECFRENRDTSPLFSVSFLRNRASAVVLNTTAHMTARLVNNYAQFVPQAKSRSEYLTWVMDIEEMSRSSWRKFELPWENFLPKLSNFWEKSYFWFAIEERRIVSPQPAIWYEEFSIDVIAKALQSAGGV